MNRYSNFASNKLFIVQQMTLCSECFLKTAEIITCLVELTENASLIKDP